MTKILEKIDCYIVMCLAFGISAIGSNIPFLYDDFVKLRYAQIHLLNPLSMFDPCAYPPFRPVVHLFYQINYRLFGITHYAGYHLSLALVHSLNTLFVYLVGKLLSGKKGVGFLAAALFASFPSNLWNIWWISNVENAITLTLFLSSFYFFIKWSKEGKGRLLVFTFLLAFLSCLAKLPAMLPFILFLYLLIFKNEISVNRRIRWIAISAMLTMTFLCYIIPRVMRAGGDILRVSFSKMYFMLTAEYGADVQGLGRHIFDNFLSYFPTLFMFDKFNHPEMPFRLLLLLGAVAVLLIFIFLDLQGRSRKYLPIIYLIFALIGVSGALIISKPLFVSLVCLFFFIYWLFFGNRFEKFSISWIFLIIIPYLFLRPASFAESRYLYFPNVGLGLLLGSIVLRTVEQLAVRFSPQGSERLAVRWLFVIIGLFFALLTTIYGHDKYLDALSIGTLEWKTHQFIYKNVPNGGKVVTIDQPGSLNFKKIQLENMGRDNIKFNLFKTDSLTDFYLGDVCFLDYRSLIHGRKVDLTPGVHYKADFEENLNAVRFQLKIYRNIREIQFSCKDGAYFRLGSGEQIIGFLAPQTSGWKRVVISCLEPVKREGKTFSLMVKIGGQLAPLVREYDNQSGLSFFIGRCFLGGGVTRVEVMNPNQESDILVYKIFLEEEGEENAPESFFSETYYQRQMYENLKPELSFKAENENEWKQWQKTLRDKLLQLLGEFPTRGPLNAETVKIEDLGEYILEKVIYQSEPGVLIPAYLLIPKGRGFPLSAVVALHGHGPGKDEIIGRIDTNLNADYGLQLVRKGYVVLAPDARGFGERATGDLEEKEATDILLFGKTIMGMRIWDAMRAIDYLESRREVDSNKIGMAGLSMGGAVTLFTSALDERIKIAVVSGYFGTFKSCYIDFHETAPCMIIPGVLRYAELYDIAGLIAPRTLVIEVGKEDPLIPTNAAQESFQKLENIYRSVGAENGVIIDLFGGGHRFNGEKAYPWLKKILFPNNKDEG